MAPNDRPIAPEPSGGYPTASVIICAFADERLELTVSAVEAVVQQGPEPLEVFVGGDHNEPLAQHLRTRLPPVVTVISNEGDPGLSSARHTAIGRPKAR